MALLSLGFLIFKMARIISLTQPPLEVAHSLVRTVGWGGGRGLSSCLTLPGSHRSLLFPSHATLGARYRTALMPQCSSSVKWDYDCFCLTESLGGLNKVYLEKAQYSVWHII